MFNLLNAIFGHLKGHKVGYVLLVILGIVLVTDTPVRAGVLHMVNIGTYDQQVKNADVINEIQVAVNLQAATQAAIQETLDDMQAFQLMSTVTNSNLPTVLRLQAYDEYTRLGYNSWVHEYFEAELKPLTKNVMHYSIQQLRK